MANRIMSKYENLKSKKSSYEQGNFSKVKPRNISRKHRGLIQHGARVYVGHTVVHLERFIMPLCVVQTADINHAFAVCFYSKEIHNSPRIFSVLIANSLNQYHGLHTEEQRASDTNTISDILHGFKTKPTVSRYSRELQHQKSEASNSEQSIFKNHHCVKLKTKPQDILSDPTQDSHYDVIVNEIRDCQNDCQNECQTYANTSTCVLAYHEQSVGIKLWRIKGKWYAHMLAPFTKTSWNKEACKDSAFHCQYFVTAVACLAGCSSLHRDSLLKLKYLSFNLQSITQDNITDQSKEHFGHLVRQSILRKQTEAFLESDISDEDLKALKHLNFRMDAHVEDVDLYIMYHELT
eukprot:8912_1